jgi:hypothetical protein
MMPYLRGVEKGMNRRWYEANTGQVVTDIQLKIWEAFLHGTLTVILELQTVDIPVFSIRL